MRARDEVSFIRVLAVLRVASVPYSSRTSPGPSRGGSVVPHRRGGSDTLSSATPSAVLLQLLVPALSFAVRRKALSDRASMHVHVHVLILPKHDRQLHRARCQHCCEPRLAQRRPRGQANVESPSSAVLQQTRSAKHDRREREAAACVAQKESRKSAFKCWHCFKTIVVHDFEHDHEDVVVPQ